MVLVEARRQAELTGEEPPPPDWFANLEPIFATCDVPGYGDNAEAEYRGGRMRRRALRGRTPP